MKKLNDLLAIQDTLMPHQVAVATGCTFDDAMMLLMVLYDRRLAESFLLVYHKGHPEVPILVRELSEGPPTVPVFCDTCERSIESDDDLAYDFIFKVLDSIDFIVAEE